MSANYVTQTVVYLLGKVNLPLTIHEKLHRVSVATETSPHPPVSGSTRLMNGAHAQVVGEDVRR